MLECSEANRIGQRENVVKNGQSLHNGFANIGEVFGPQHGLLKIRYSECVATLEICFAHAGNSNYLATPALLSRLIEEHQRAALKVLQVVRVAQIYSIRIQRC